MQQLYIRSGRLTSSHSRSSSLLPEQAQLLAGDHQQGSPGSEARRPCTTGHAPRARSPFANDGATSATPLVRLPPAGGLLEDLDSDEDKQHDFEVARPAAAHRVVCTLGRPCNRSNCNFCHTSSQLAVAGYHRLTHSLSNIPFGALEAELGQPPAAAAAAAPEQAAAAADPLLLASEAVQLQRVADASLLLEVQARQQLGRPYGLPMQPSMRAVDPWAVGSRRTTLDSQLLAAVMYADEAPAGGLGMHGMYGGSRLQEAGLIPAERGGGGGCGLWSGCCCCCCCCCCYCCCWCGGAACQVGPMMSEGVIRVTAAAGDGGQGGGGLQVPHYSHTVE
jgi:hypothetical protein